MLEQLIDRARQGDHEAFDALAQIVGDRLMAIAYRILRDADLAQDAVQTALVKAWRELPGLRRPDRFEAWVHRILVNACYQEARHRRVPALSLVTLSQNSTSAEDEILAVDRRDQLERGFRRLPPEQRAVLVFHHYLGLSLAQISDQLDIPIGTAKSRLRYATAALRAALEADARTSDNRKEGLA